MTSLGLLLKYLLIMELRFDAILYSCLAAEILMRAISNVRADHRVPIPDLEQGSQSGGTPTTENFVHARTKIMFWGLRAECNGHVCVYFPSIVSKFECQFS